MLVQFHIILIVAIACLAIGCECFTPALRTIPFNARPAVKIQIRPLRFAPRASLYDGYYSLATTATNLLLAIDDEGSKVEKLYDEVSETVAAEVY